MELTDTQKQAVDCVVRLFDEPDRQVVRLFGAAGTGKTTIASAAAEKLGNCTFAAFTGKAAQVLTSKGCPARTIHSLIYRVLPKSEENLRRLEARVKHAAAMVPPAPELYALERELAAMKAKSSQPRFCLNPDSDIREYSAIILDEVSMIPGPMADDLMSFGVKILALGDPYQLPPVMGTGYFTQGKADILLRTVMRQAADSPVLKLATLARESRPIEQGVYEESRVVPKGTLSLDELMGHDQVIVGTNRTRRTINKLARQRLGRTTDLPTVGDRLICLKNNRDECLMNGAQFTVLAADQMCLTLEALDGSGQVETIYDDQWFLDPDYRGSPWADGNAFDYAYAITCHKAQGSEWGSVAIVDESRAFRADASKWLYTALTRASERVTLIQT